MTALVILLACVAAAAAVTATVALLALRRARQESARERAALGERVEALESRLREPAPAPVARAEHEFVITRLGEPEEAATPAVGPAVQVRLPAPAFADAVLRETVVQTASLVHGVRRALAPEVRHRIRSEYKREAKRARKARKAEAKLALREYRARRRAEAAALLDGVRAADVTDLGGREGAA